MNASELLELHSGQTHLAVSSKTGKIVSLQSPNANLFVSAHDEELERALTDENRSQFGSLDAWGGDECYPTVGGSELWGIRDHGSLWSRTPTLQYAQPHQCTTGWQTKHGQFKRSILPAIQMPSPHRLGAYTFQCEFSSQVPCTREDGTLFPQVNLLSLYASHALFAAEAGDWVEWGTVPQALTLEDALSNDVTREILAMRVFAEDKAPMASKFYLQTQRNMIFCTSLVRKRLGVRIDVLQDDSLPWVGIWWCHNGWGDGRPHSTVGIEPTNIPSDGPVLTLGHRPENELKKVRFAWVVSKHSK